MIQEYFDNELSKYRYPFLHKKTGVSYFKKEKGIYENEKGEQIEAAHQSFKLQKPKKLEISAATNEFFLIINCSSDKYGFKDYNIEISKQDKELYIYKPYEGAEEHTKELNVLNLIDFFIKKLKNINTSSYRSGSFCYFDIHSSKWRSYFRKFFVNENEYYKSFGVLTHFYYYEYDMSQNQHVFESKESYSEELKSLISELENAKKLFKDCKFVVTLEEPQHY